MTHVFMKIEGVIVFDNEKRRCSKTGVTSPSAEEVEHTLQTQKRGISPGEDQIVAGLLKLGEWSTLYVAIT